MAPMAFTVWPDGRIDCPTLEEALRVRAEIINNGHGLQNGETGAPRHNRKQPRAERVGNPNFNEFFQALGENAKKIMLALANHPDGLDTDALAQAIHLATTALPPIIRSIRTTAGHHGFDRGSMVGREKYSLDGRPKSRYKLDREFIELVKSHR